METCVSGISKYHQAFQNNLAMDRFVDVHLDLDLQIKITEKGQRHSERLEFSTKLESFLPTVHQKRKQLLIRTMEHDRHEPSEYTSVSNIYEERPY